jgi:hypothetical protein
MFECADAASRHTVPSCILERDFYVESSVGLSQGCFPLQIPLCGPHRSPLSLALLVAHGYTCLSSLYECSCNNITRLSPQLALIHLTLVCINPDSIYSCSLTLWVGVNLSMWKGSVSSGFPWCPLLPVYFPQAHKSYNEVHPSQDKFCCLCLISDKSIKDQWIVSLVEFSQLSL